MTKVVACRYWYELSDGFLGQWTVTQLPHSKYSDSLPVDCKHIPGLQDEDPARRVLSGRDWAAVLVFQLVF